VERRSDFYRSLETAKAIIVFGANQRTVDAWRTDLKRIGSGDRVGDVEKGGNATADLCTIIMCDWQIVETLGHYLQCRLTTADHEHPHKTIAHCGKRWLDHLRDSVCINQESWASQKIAQQQVALSRTKADA